jgi:hypothetical protein
MSRTNHEDRSELVHCAERREREISIAGDRGASRNELSQHGCLDWRSMRELLHHTARSIEIVINDACSISAWRSYQVPGKQLPKLSKLQISLTDMSEPRDIFGHCLTLLT